jgi:GTP-binding protein
VSVLCAEFITGVRVLLDVDATKLHDHPVLKNEKFSKIIFNFPHIGGKMKIHLNRALLKRFFQSASEMVTMEGRILVTLCKGQGGTRVDRPVRRWDDTWQVVEMAGHGNLVLVSVEQFRNDIFPKYTSVGYRGGGTAFHTDGALVHVFSKRELLYPSTEVETLLDLKDQVLQTNFGNVICESVYVAKYRNNPFQMEGSAVHYLNKQLKAFVETLCFKVRQISDADVPLHAELPTGGPVCHIDGQGFECSLRHSLLDIMDDVLKLWNQAADEIIMFPGVVFNAVGTDFSFPPLSCHVLLLGNELSGVIEQYIRRMLQKFKKDVTWLSVSHFENVEECSHKFTSGKNIFVKNNTLSDVTVKVAQEFSLALENSSESSFITVNLVHLDQLSELLFDIDNWRQLWARGSCVVFDKNIPMLKHSCFESLAYTHDICFSESPTFSVMKFYSILWQTAADIITNVEFLNLYESPYGWKSHCYRITYQSFDKALSKQKAFNVQETVIGKMLCVKLGVSIR